MDLLTHLGQGALGGFILNVMPCVFPVLFFKIGSLIEHRDLSNHARRVDAVAYLLGTFITFAGFAALVIALRAAGESLGWGMQMQNPGFVAALVGLLFIFGLNSVGVFHLNLSIGSAAGKGGPLASVVDGILITLVSTPCSAPFLGGAAAAALASDTAWWETVLLFWSVGFGLALPILLIGFVPGLARLLPRPGGWMETFKILVGFTLFGAAIWLFATFQEQVTPESANTLLWVLLAAAGALWMKERITHSQLVGMRRILLQITVLGGAVAFGAWYIQLEPAAETVAPVVVAAPVSGAKPVVPDNVVWTPFTEEVKTAALQRGQPVFVDFTATWCASCKVFEKTHINVHEVRQVLAETGIMAAKADLTKPESNLWGTLNKLGRSGLPTYVIYLPDGTHDLFPEGPPLDLANKLRSVSARFPLEQFKPN